MLNKLQAVANRFEELCAKCDDFSKAWKPVATEIWENNPHPKTHTQYYRDHK